MITTTLRDAIMAALIDVGGPWDPAAVFVGTFETINDQGIDTVLADLVLPPGALATAVAVGAWRAAKIKPDGRSVAEDATGVEVRPASSAEATTLQGWYLADAATAGDLLAFGYFTDPISLPDETRAVTVIARVVVDPTGGTWTDTKWLNG